MKKLFIVAIGFFILALPLSVHAISYDLFTFTGDDASVTVTITPYNNDFQFDLEVNPYGPENVIGDLRGFWFNIEPFPATIPPSGFIYDAGVATAYDYWVTDYVVSDDSVQNIGPTIAPAGPFDVGVVLGTPGIGSDDIQATTFWVSGLGGDIELADFNMFAARLTSVGPAGSYERDGSSKLIVPEPATMLLLGSGLLGFAAARRKKKYFKK